MRQGVILVVSGPAGSGKGTVCRILKESGDFTISVSRTTRKPRPGETNGVEYSFISRDEFLRLLEEGDFLEYNQYCGQYYGTPKKAAEDIIASGRNMILEIDVHGGLQVKKQCPRAVLIMLLPPSYEEQERRLRHRGTESEELIQKRLNQAKEELKFLDQYDYVVYNYTNETYKAADQLRAIAEAERCSVKLNPDAEKDFFNNINHRDTD